MPNRPTRAYVLAILLGIIFLVGTDALLRGHELRRNEFAYLPHLFGSG